MTLIDGCICIFVSTYKTSLSLVFCTILWRHFCSNLFLLVFVPLNCCQTSSSTLHVFFFTFYPFLLCITLWDSSVHRYKKHIWVSCCNFFFLTKESCLILQEPLNSAHIPEAVKSLLFVIFLWVNTRYYWEYFNHGLITRAATGKKWAPLWTKSNNTTQKRRW